MGKVNARKYLNPNPNKGSLCGDHIIFTQEQKDEMLEAFTLFAKEGTGLVSTKDLGKVMRSLGQVLTVCEETDIVAYFAQEKCYNVDFITFVRLMTNKYRHFDEENELVESFRRFDKEEKGVVCIKDLRKMLTTIGETLTAEEVNEWLEDGKPYIENKGLHYDEFAAFMLTK